jgi:O-antigen/teichoic acid export membrane protein
MLSGDGIWQRLERSSLASRLIRGAFWSLAGTAASRCLGLAASISVARILGKVAMGELGIIQSTVGMFSAFAGMGLGLAATKHVAEYQAKDRSLAGETIGMLSIISWSSGLLMTVLMIGVSPWLAHHNLAAPQLATPMRIGSLLLLFGVINGVQTGVLSGFEAFKSIARVNLISGLANFPLMLCGTYWWGLRGAVSALVASLALNCILNFFAVRREAAKARVNITFKHFHRHRNLIWTFGLPGMLSGAISGPVGWITSLTLVKQPGGYAEMGIYNAASNWFQLVVFLPNLLAQVLLPILSSYAAKNDGRGLNRALVLATWTNVIVVFPIIAVGCALSRFIMGLYGPGFAEGWPVLAWTLLSAGVLTIQGPITDRLVATAKMWAYFLAHIVWGMIFIGTAFLWVPAHGGTGLALARLAAYIANGLWVVGVSWWYLGQPSNKNIGKAASVLEPITR